MGPELLEILFDKGGKVGICYQNSFEQRQVGPEITMHLGAPETVEDRGNLAEIRYRDGAQSVVHAAHTTEDSSLVYDSHSRHIAGTPPIDPIDLANRALNNFLRIAASSMHATHVMFPSEMHELDSD